MIKGVPVTEQHLANPKQVYVIVNSSRPACERGFEKGARLLLDDDDGTDMLYFKLESDPKRKRWMHLACLRAVPMEAEIKPEPAPKQEFKVGGTVTKNS